MLCNTIACITASDTVTPAKRFLPGCKIYRVPRDGGKAERVDLDDVSISGEGGLGDQVLVFRWRGRVYAVDHVRSFSFEMHFLCGYFITTRG